MRYVMKEMLYCRFLRVNIIYNYAKVTTVLRYNFPFYQISEMFTCTSSSTYVDDTSATYACNNVYDSSSTTEWFTLAGEGKDAWIQIQFQKPLEISKLVVQQVGHNPLNSFRNTRFDKLDVTYSSGSRLLELGSVDGGFNVLYFDPPITENNIKLTATEYSFDRFDFYPYGLREISIYGPASK